MHYLLIYKVGDDFSVRRDEFRKEHLALAWQSVERGELIVGGAFADPVDIAMLLFATDNQQMVKDFALADPYVRHGLVLRWSVRRWSTVVGNIATTPVY
ncbi:MAG: YciI-like protein [Cuniculiplasma sp.]